MHKLSKREIIAVLIVIIAVGGVAFFPRYISEDVTPSYQPDSSSPNSSSNETDNENTSADETVYSPVFCEFASSTTCKHCPKIGGILYEIYDESKYPFSVVSLVYDKNTLAKKRLIDDYNVLGFPTVFLNGGEKVIYGSDVDKSEVENIIRSLAKQEKPEIKLSLSLFWDENTSVLHTKVSATNNESNSYEGVLKVYLLEINSRWYDYDGKPYRFALLTYTLDTQLSLKPGETKNFTSDWDGSKYKPIDKDNLLATAVVFSQDTVDRYSDPPDNTRSFSAHSVDTVVTQRIGTGNLPPQVGISSPKKGMFNLRSKPLMWTLFGSTWVVGKTDVNVLVNDDGNFIKLEFYVDNTLKQTVSDSGRMDNKQYTFALHGPLFGQHTLKVKAYDSEGKTAETKMIIKTFILLP
ncbi:MAG TPA: hypothetical protein ENI45_00455 [Thermoplasmatales archaeon]|nr:hypothetical protein [Thermoplasmatales archaeon]